MAAATSSKSSKSHELDVTAVLLPTAFRFREFPQYIFGLGAVYPDCGFLAHPRLFQVISDHNLGNIRIKPYIQIFLLLDAIYFQLRNIVK